MFASSRCSSARLAVGVHVVTNRNEPVRLPCAPQLHLYIYIYCYMLYCRVAGECEHFCLTGCQLFPTLAVITSCDVSRYSCICFTTKTSRSFCVESFNVEQQHEMICLQQQQLNTVTKAAGSSLYSPAWTSGEEVHSDDGLVECWPLHDDCCSCQKRLNRCFAWCLPTFAYILLQKHLKHAVRQPLVSITSLKNRLQRFETCFIVFKVTLSSFGTFVY